MVGRGDGMNVPPHSPAQGLPPAGQPPGTEFEAVPQQKCQVPASLKIESGKARSHIIMCLTSSPKISSSALALTLRWSQANDPNSVEQSADQMM